MAHDLFICHASEDKEAFVRPLAEALVERGIEVWYDEFSLRVGDGLRDSINKGLASSRYGLVVLSQAFFSKNWTQWELDALVQRHISRGFNVLLPIWHEVESDDVSRFSLSIANIVALNSSNGIEFNADRIAERVSADQAGVQDSAALRHSKSIWDVKIDQLPFDKSWYFATSSGGQRHLDEALSSIVGFAGETHASHLVISGPAGSGKSRLACETMRNAGKAFPVRYSVNSATRSSLFSGLSGLCRLANVPLDKSRSPSIEELVEAIIASKLPKPILITLDNFGDPQEIDEIEPSDTCRIADIRPLLLNSNEIKIILTCQDDAKCRYPWFSFHSLRLSELPPDDAIQFCMTRSGVDEDSRKVRMDIATLLEKRGTLPLDLEMYSLDVYAQVEDRNRRWQQLAEFGDSLHIPSARMRELGIATSQERSRALVQILSTSASDQDSHSAELSLDCLKVLSIASLLHHRELLRENLKAGFGGQPQRFDEACDALTRRGILNKTEDGRLAMHLEMARAARKLGSVPEDEEHIALLLTDLASRYSEIGHEVVALHCQSMSKYCRDSPGLKGLASLLLLDNSNFVTETDMTAPCVEQTPVNVEIRMKAFGQSPLSYAFRYLSLMHSWKIGDYASLTNEMVTPWEYMDSSCRCRWIPSLAKEIDKPEVKTLFERVKVINVTTKGSLDFVHLFPNVAIFRAELLSQNEPWHIPPADQLVELSLVGDATVSLFNLPSLKRLLSLNFGGTKFEGSCPTMLSVKQLSLRGCAEDCVERFLALSNLEHINLIVSEVSSLDWVEAFPRLTSLELHGTNVEDLGPLKACQSLRWLDLHGLKPRSLEPLRGLKGCQVFLPDGGKWSV